MALKSTIFKVKLSVADITRNYYEDHDLTLARHPSETDLRMLVRVIAFALNAHEHLKFGKGISSPEEPDLWQVDLTGEIIHWIDLGQPQEKRIRQACSKARQVSVYTYQPGAAISWFKDIETDLERFDHLRVINLGVGDDSLVAKLIARTMALNCTIEDDQIMLANDANNVFVQMKVVKDFK